MPKILYVDDDETSRLSISRLLQQEGFEVVTARCGREGAKVVRELEFDCLISDLNMEGNANLAFIREMPEVRPGLPIIIVTGYPSVETAVASIRLPVAAYLLKPLDYEELLTALRNALQRAMLMQQVQAMHNSVGFWLTDLAQLLEALRQSSRMPLAAPSDIFLTITYRNVLDALLSLKTVLEGSVTVKDAQAIPSGSGTSPLLLVEALRETIAVLEKTKDSFRSRDLGELRKKLESLLDVEREQRKPNGIKPAVPVLKMEGRCPSA